MKKILFTVALATYIILILSTTVLGFTPKLVTKINDAFKDAGREKGSSKSLNNGHFKNTELQKDN